MADIESKSTPRQIIERIRTHNFLLDIDAESDIIKEGARSLQTTLNNALKLLSDDLYSKKSHFVLELVQNADDNRYADGITPHLTIFVTPTCLSIVNNEVGFTEDNVKAICNVGASSKSKQKSGYIGEKGIGFKSVFTVSDMPEIHSNGFHFKFDRTTEDNLLGYIVPHWCDTPKFIRDDSTTIILPAASTYTFGTDTIIDLDARLLLFLNKLRKLTLNKNGICVTYHREDAGAISNLYAQSQPIEGQQSTQLTRYVRASQSFSIGEKQADEKRQGIEQSTIVLAFPIDEKGNAKPDPASFIFAFLPIRQVGFKFSVQGDFILSSSREEILTDRPWNQFLRNGIASVFTNAIMEFKKSDALALTYLKYIPEVSEIADPFFQSIRNEIIERMQNEECLLSASRVWNLPKNLRSAERSFRKLFPSAIATELFGFDYIDQRLQGSNEVLRSLGLKEITSQDVLEVFNGHSTWLKQQPLEWRAKFFAYIADHREELLTAGLFNCQCLPVSDGSFVVPANTNVFFPIGKGKKYGFESELNLIDNELFEEAKKYSPFVEELFQMLKVRTDEPYDLVMAHILPKHKGESWKTSDFKALVGHLRYIKDKVQDYLTSALSHGKSETAAFNMLRDGIWIGTKHKNESTWTFARAGTLYLGNEYKPVFCVETYLEDSLEKARFVSPDYLSKKSKDSDAETESWRQFFKKLGVCFTPIVLAHGADWKCSLELQKLLDSPSSSTRKATLECMNLHWSYYSSHLTYNLQSGRNNYGPRETLFSHSIKNTQAPTKKRTTQSLAESYYRTTELASLFGDALPYVDAQLSEPMLDACGVTHKLDAKVLIKRLVQLKAETGGTAKQLQAIYRALEGSYWDSGSAYIKQAFNEYSLIQVKGLHKGWFKPSEVSWKSNSIFLDSIYPPLQSMYRDFSKFFLDKLGVPKELPTSKWVEALTRLDELESPDERRLEALKIYRRANQDLLPKFGREVQIPDWIDVFRTEEVYLNQRNELVVNDEYLFANDDPETALLFEDDEELSFLAVPKSDVPRLGRLLDAADVSRLSRSISIDVVNAQLGQVNNEHTQRIRQSSDYIARVLYTKRNEDFDKALADGLFDNLKKFVVVEVPQVELLVSIGDYARETTAEIALSGERILYRTGARAVIDKLAAELSKYFCSSTELADTFARILMEDDVENIEDFLQVRNIDTIPPDLFNIFDFGHVEENIEDEPSSSTTDKSTTESDNTDSQTSLNHSDSDESTNPDGPPVNITLAPKSNPIPVTVTELETSLKETETRKHADNSDNGLPNTASGPIRAPGSSDQSAMQQSDESKDANIRLPIQSSSTVSFRGSDRRRTRQSQGRQKNKPARTKAGRLLSYATGPGDATKTGTEDDPARAAAREATGRAAVEYFLATEASRWKSVTEMPHNNPGFDVLAITNEGHEEFIEVKGQSGAWTEEGVALTPTELLTAQKKGESFLLCVVEYAHDERRRNLYMLRNPFGLTQQFRYDAGWKSAAENVTTALLKPERDMYIAMPGVGHGRVLSVRTKGRFFNLHVILDDGRQINKLFNPASMTLSKDSMWQG